MDEMSSSGSGLPPYVEATMDGFAGLAMQTYLQASIDSAVRNGRINAEITEAVIAKSAYDLAEEMMKERARRYKKAPGLFERKM